MPNLQTDPIYKPFTQPARWPRTLFQAVILCVVTSLLSTLLIRYIAVEYDLFWQPPLKNLIWLGLAVTGINYAAIHATVITQQNIQSETFQLMKLSTLSSGQIVDAFIQGVYYRMRVWWMMMGAGFLAYIVDNLMAPPFNYWTTFFSAASLIMATYLAVGYGMLTAFSSHALLKTSAFIVMSIGGVITLWVLNRFIPGFIIHVIVLLLPPAWVMAYWLTRHFRERTIEQFWAERR